MKTRKEEASLNVKLGMPDIRDVNNILSMLKDLPEISANNLLSEIRTGGYKSKRIDAIFSVLSLEEYPAATTYQDPSNKDMTIGIGLDIQHPNHDDAKAVLKSVNPDLKFEEMQKQIGLPNPALTSNEIKEILYYTLIGARYNDPENGTITFTGKIQNLIDHMEKFVPGLADAPFKPHELVCLISMAFNTPALIGKEFCKALDNYKKTKDSMDVALQIMEGSNKLYNDDGSAKNSTNGLQNRRMRELALFLNDPAGVHISYRQYKRIEEALATLGQTVAPQNGHPVYSQPHGENELTFKGGDKLEKKESIYKEDEKPFITYYSSKQGETITVGEEEVDSIVFGGDGDDMIIVKGNHEWSYPYLAGGEGSNHYKISSQAGHVLIYDKNGQGKITIDDQYILQGIAMASSASKNKYELSIKDRKYNLDNGLEANSLKISWNDSENDIVIPNFSPGRLNLILASPSTQLTMRNIIAIPTLLPKTGNFVFVQGLPSIDNIKQLVAQIITPKGELIQSILLTTISCDIGCELQVDVAIETPENGKFVIVWRKSSQTFPGPSGFIVETQIQGAVCSENGISQSFDFILPSGEHTAKLTTDEDGNQEGCQLLFSQIVSMINNFAVICSAAYTSKTGNQSVLLSQMNGIGLSNKIINKNEYLFVSGLSPLNDGNAVIALATKTFDNPSDAQLSIHIMNPMGAFIKSFSHGVLRGIVSLSPLGKGFKLIVGNMTTNSLNSIVFDGENWSQMLSIPNKDEVFGEALISRTLSNGHTLVSWLAINMFTQQLSSKTLLIDSKNETVGDVINIDSKYIIPLNICPTSGHEDLLVLGTISSDQNGYDVIMNVMTYSFKSSNQKEIKTLSNLGLFKKPNEIDINDFVLVGKNNDSLHEEYKSKSQKCSIM